MSGVRALLTAALIPLILFTAGCQTVTGRSFGHYVDDGVTKAKVKSNLVTAKASNLPRVGVAVKNQTVYLHGVVDSAADKAQAGQIAAGTDGVRHVVNDLQLARYPGVGVAGMGTPEATGVLR